jgi:hypothetical protein
VKPITFKLYQIKSFGGNSVEQVKKIRLNNHLTYLTTAVLIFSFVFTLVFVTLPQLPNYPSAPGERRLFVSTWNFACTLMWVIVLRVQVFNEMTDIIKRKENKRRVTPWVRFWFIGSILIGSATVLYVLHSFVTAPPVGLLYSDILSIIAIASWIALIALSLLLFFSRREQSGGMLPDVERALPVHRWLLAPASVLFFLSTFFFPLIFLL